MSAYVVSARVAPGRPHAAPPPGPRVDAKRREPAAEDDRLIDTSPPGQRELELRLEAISERWSQLTFFLFDPESWR